VDPRLRQQIRESLREEFKHHALSAVVCPKCGADARPLATHIAVSLNGSPGINPRSWVQQATSYAPDRGGLALCDKCVPPCRKCQLPVVEGATARWLRSEVSELLNVPMGRARSILGFSASQSDGQGGILEGPRDRSGKSPRRAGRCDNARSCR